MGATIGAGISAGISDLASFLAAGYDPDDYYKNEDEYIVSLDSPTVSNGTTGFTTTLYLPFEQIVSGPSNSLSYSFYGSFDNFHISSLSSSASFAFGDRPSIDNSATPGGASKITFSTHCYQSGSIYFLVKTSSFTPSVDCLVDVSSSFDKRVIQPNNWTHFAYCISDPSYSFPVDDRHSFRGGYTYCLYGLFSVSLSFNSGNSVTNHTFLGPSLLNFPSVSISYDGDSSQVPITTRPTYITNAITNYNSENNEYNYFIGKIDNSNNVTNVYNVNIFDETTNEFRDPYTDKPYQVTNWVYDYAQRLYLLTLADDTLLYNGKSIKNLVVWYGDDALYYIGIDDTFVVDDYTTVDDLMDHIVFTDSFQYIIAEKKDDSGTGSDGHKHVFTSETTTPPSCTGTGVRTYSCQFCDYSYDEIIPAAGHQWEVTEVKDTEFNDNGDVTAAGYTLYTCAVCGETYKQWSNTGQPGPPTGNTGTGSGGGGSGSGSGEGSSFWGKLKDSVLGLLSDLIDAVFGLITDVLSAVLGLVKDLLSFFFSFLSDTVIKGITDLFSAFGSIKLELPEGVSSVFGFFSGVILALPAEIKSLFIFGVAALFLIAIFKLVKA